MTSFEKYLYEKQKYLLKISDVFCIKRIYTNNEIVFECVKEPTIFTTKDINKI